MVRGQGSDLVDRSLTHYQIIAAVGAGGMIDGLRSSPWLDREVAVEVLPGPARGDRDARARFRREALALSPPNHPHIEMVLDLGDESGVDYLVLEIVPGETRSVEILGRTPQALAALAARVRG